MNFLGLEDYLTNIENINHRTALTKLRLSNHSLQIEKGRHQNIEKNQRFCPFCPDSIEDEKHFLVACRIYNTLREDLYEWVETQINNFYQYDYTKQFIHLTTNPICMKKTASYIFRQFNIRTFLMNKHKNKT